MATTVHDAEGSDPILELWANGSSTKKLVVKSDGKTGIGTTAPTATLDVSGNILAQKLKVSGTASDQDPNTLYPRNIVKAWAQFDGSTTPIELEDSIGVNTLTDHGTGDYSVNWINSFVNSQYCVVGGARKLNSTRYFGLYRTGVPLTTGAVRVNTWNSVDFNDSDSDHVMVIAMGGQT